MSTFVLSDCKLWVQEFDLSGDWNAGTLVINQELKECTQFNDTARTWCADTIKSHNLSIKGYHDNDTILAPDDYIHGEYGVNDIVCTVGPSDGLDGSPAYCFKSAISSYSPIDSTWGDVAGYSMEAGGTGDIVRGTVMKNATSNITGNGNGTAYQLGTCDATQTVYGILHVHEFDGGDLVVKIYSDDAEGFPSGAEELAFTSTDDVTSEWISSAGDASGNDWWRAQWTYDGTACKFVVAIAII